MKNRTKIFGVVIIFIIFAVFLNIFTSAATTYTIAGKDTITDANFEDGDNLVIHYQLNANGSIDNTTNVTWKVMNQDGDDLEIYSNDTSSFSSGFKNGQIDLEISKDKINETGTNKIVLEAYVAYIVNEQLVLGDKLATKTVTIKTSNDTVAYNTELNILDKLTSTSNKTVYGEHTNLKEISTDNYYLKSIIGTQELTKRYFFNLDILKNTFPNKSVFVPSTDNVKISSNITDYDNMSLTYSNKLSSETNFSMTSPVLVLDTGTKNAVTELENKIIKYTIKCYDSSNALVKTITITVDLVMFPHDTTASYTNGYLYNSNYTSNQYSYLNYNNIFYMDYTDDLIKSSTDPDTQITTFNTSNVKLYQIDDTGTLNSKSFVITSKPYATGLLTDANTFAISLQTSLTTGFYSLTILDGDGKPASIYTFYVNKFKDSATTYILNNSDYNTDSIYNLKVPVDGKTYIFLDSLLKDTDTDEYVYNNFDYSVSNVLDNMEYSTDENDENYISNPITVTDNIIKVEGTTAIKNFDIVATDGTYTKTITVNVSYIGLTTDVVKLSPNLTSIKVPETTLANSVLDADLEKYEEKYEGYIANVVKLNPIVFRDGLTVSNSNIVWDIKEEGAESGSNGGLFIKDDKVYITKDAIPGIYKIYAVYGVGSAEYELKVNPTTGTTTYRVAFDVNASDFTIDIPATQNKVRNLPIKMYKNNIEFEGLKYTLQISGFTGKGVSLVNNTLVITPAATSGTGTIKVSLVNHPEATATLSFTITDIIEDDNQKDDEEDTDYNTDITVVFDGFSSSSGTTNNLDYTSISGTSKEITYKMYDKNDVLITNSYVSLALDTATTGIIIKNDYENNSFKVYVNGLYSNKSVPVIVYDANKKIVTTFTLRVRISKDYTCSMSFEKDYIKKNDSFVVDGTFSNKNTTEIKNVCLAIVAYDKTGKMIDSNINYQQVGVSTQASFSAKIRIPSTIDGLTIRAFFINGQSLGSLIGFYSEPIGITNKEAN